MRILIALTTTCSVIEKLLAADAIQLRKNKEPTFTDKFRNYCTTYSAENKEALLFVHGWRQMLARFHLSLVDMTDEELSIVVRLLEYQHETTKVIQPYTKKK